MDSQQAGRFCFVALRASERAGDQMTFQRSYGCLQRKREQIIERGVGCRLGRDQDRKIVPCDERAMRDQHGALDQVFEFPTLPG